MREERKKVWIDDFQTKLLRRTFLYWLVYTVSLWNILFIWWLLPQEGGNPLEQYSRFFTEFYPALIAFAIVFPVLAFDAIKFSHRLVGPIYRFRKTIESIANGEAVRPIKLREGDFLTEMRDELNRMLETLQRKGIPVLKPTDADEQSRERKPA